MELTEVLFNSLSTELSSVAPIIPVSWHNVQNDRLDNQLKNIGCNIFDITSLSELRNAICGFSQKDQEYYTRRWFMIRLADCDEYLFYRQTNVVRNPNQFDKQWDICINNSIHLDVKGTRLPKESEWRNCWCLQQCKNVYDNPRPLVEWYFCKQSTGIRKGYQNRLFIVHLSKKDRNRELQLRCLWNIKQQIFQIYVENISKVQFIPTMKDGKQLQCSIIFIVEMEDGSIGYRIYGFNDQFVKIDNI